MTNTGKLAIVTLLSCASWSCESSSYDWFWGYQEVALYCEADVDCDYTDYPTFTSCDMDGSKRGVRNTCVEQQVVMCEDSMGCTDAEAPICDMTSHTCRACDTDGVGGAGDAECAGIDEMAPYCVAGGCVACLADDGTGASTCDGLDAPICDAANSCQMCMDNTECEMQHPDEPVCDVNGHCVACQEHTDCPSQVCDTDMATCVAEGDIIYVDPTGMDGVGCGSVLGPCKTISGAQGALAQVTGSRMTIRLADATYTESVTVDATTVPTGVVRLLGPATVAPPGLSNVPAIYVDDGRAVILDTVTLAGATGGNSADGLRCQNTSTVQLMRVSVLSNAALGVNANGCTVTIEASTFSGNSRGGISLTDSAFSVRNSFIVGNGNALSAVGGVSIFSNSDFTPQVFEFNTVAGNSAQGADGVGVYCRTGTPMTASNNIVYLNGDTPVSGNCSWTYSNITNAPGGTGNLDMDPMFVDTNNGDFHLQSNSPCRDTADPAATLARDFDNDARPQDSGHDMGADEIVP